MKTIMNIGLSALLLLSMSAGPGFAADAPVAASEAGVAPAAGLALDLSTLGFPTTIPELLLLERLNSSLRYDSEATIDEEWGDSYDRITVIDLAAVKNRYGIFENEKARRMDIAIRGTVNLRNAVSDIEFLKRRSDALGIYLHTGFEGVANALYADLRPRLRTGWTIRVAGHSLGAAEAIIVGMRLSKDGYAVEKVLASAPPKVTDAEGWSHFANLAVIRLAGPHDPVPFLPPRAVLYGRDPYIQGGRLFYVLDGKKACVLEGAFFDDLPDGDLPGPSTGDRLDAKDHALLTYMRRLLAKTEGIELVDPRDWEKYALPAAR